MDKIKKVLGFEIKQVGPEEDRVLRFVGSDESIDRDNDIIEVAGWKLDDYLKNPVFLWAHDYSQPPVGKAVNVTIDAVAKKLLFDIKFATAEEYPFADTIYKLYKGGYLSATSVGFTGIKYKTRDDDEVLELPEWRRGRRYLEQSLLEISSVPVPSNPNALQQARSAGIDVEIVEKAIKGQGGNGISVYLTEESKATELIAKTREFLKDFGLEPTEIIVDGKEAQVCAKIGQDDSVSFGFDFLEGNKRGLVMATPHDLLVPKKLALKTADLEGNPSTWDIMDAIRLAINPTGVYTSGGPWIEDLYPINYPSGSVIIEKNEKLYLYQYEYTDGVATLSIDFVELEETYKPKGFRDKSGATISRKNKEMLDQICKEMEGGSGKLRKFIDTAGMEDEPMMTAQMTAPVMTANMTADMTAGMTMPMMSAMRTAEITEIKQALDELKSQVLILCQKTDVQEVAKQLYELQKVTPDATKEIDLDAIELPKPVKDPANIELNIEPGELKTMIEETVKNLIQGGN